MTVKFVLATLRSCPPGFRLCGMTLLNEDLCALSTDAITLSIYAMEVFQIVIGVLFPIVDVEQQLITQCIKKFI